VVGYKWGILKVREFLYSKQKTGLEFLNLFAKKDI